LDELVLRLEELRDAIVADQLAKGLGAPRRERRTRIVDDGKRKMGWEER
jgi:hypothetical protein